MTVIALRNILDDVNVIQPTDGSAMTKHSTNCRKLVRRVHSQYRNRVRECRLRAMIAKQEVLALRTGIPRTTLSALETNKLFLSAPYALLIRDVLGCTLDDLYGRREPGLGDNGKPTRQEG